MQLTAEIKDDNYAELPRQQEAHYASSTDTLLRADASTGKHYFDLNAAAKSYSGPWLFGREHIQISVNGMKAQWMQWCPVPADIRDGIQMRGNVIYQNPNGTYRTSGDLYEGAIESHGDEKYFVGRTQHTFFANNLPGGQLKVVANIKIELNERLPYNPMLTRSSSPPAQNVVASYGQQAVSYGNSSGNLVGQPQGQNVDANYGSQNNYQEPQYGQSGNAPLGDSEF